MAEDTTAGTTTGVEGGKPDDGTQDGGNARASLDRILAHAEAQGEVYVGATNDLARVRALLPDGKL